MNETDAQIREQLCFDLRPADPYSAQYFVSHSGAAEAQALLTQLWDDVCCNPSCFRAVFIHGAPGAGKTHLIEAFGETRANRELLTVMELPLELSDDEVPEVVSTYDRIKRSGGLLVFTSRHAPHDVTANPHARSRFLAASSVCLKPPREVELDPIIRSLMERRNLRLSQAALEYLLARMPANLLSFGEVLDRLAEECFAGNRPAKRAAAKEVLENPGKK